MTVTLDRRARPVGEMRRPTARMVRIDDNNALGLDEQGKPVAVCYRDAPDAPWILETASCVLFGIG